jgi:hypothetical protein
MKREHPNPAGREGKPFSLHPHTFDEVVRKMVTTPPPPKAEAKPQRKSPKKPAKRR